MDEIANKKENKNMNFESLQLDNWLIEQCKAMGLSKPTPIQQNCIPPIINGNDCIGCAKTGSGKTAAFALPILQKLSEDPFGIFALVITPTRELAFQIAEQFNVLGKPVGVRVTVITGGLDMMQQGLDLSVKPHIVISTPGRLADHLDSCNTFSLRKIKFLVLDEADRLIEDDFGEQLEAVFKVLPKKRQTLLFSATMTQTLQDLQQIALNKPFFWEQQSLVATVEQLTQHYVLMSADVKDAYMMHILDTYSDAHPKSSIMVFTTTCKYTQILGMVCQELGFNCVVLHSMIRQKERLAALAKFKSNQVRILIATDVASRGLDLPMVDLIINHNIPNKPKNYIHRVGRTARAGRCGMAISLVTQFDIKLVHAIEKTINTELTEYATEEKEVMKILTEVAVARREAEIKLDERDFGEQKEINKRKKLILEGKDPDEEERKKKKMIKDKFRKIREERLAASQEMDEIPAKQTKPALDDRFGKDQLATAHDLDAKPSKRPKTSVDDRFGKDQLATAHDLDAKPSKRPKTSVDDRFGKDQFTVLHDSEPKPAKRQKTGVDDRFTHTPGSSDNSTSRSAKLVDPAETVKAKRKSVKGAVSQLAKGKDTAETAKAKRKSVKGAVSQLAKGKDTAETAKAKRKSVQGKLKDVGKHVDSESVESSTRSSKLKNVKSSNKKKKLK